MTDLAQATARLRAAGLASPDVDARILWEEDPDNFTDNVARRESREPLQHILGKAWFRYLELRVGPGVFVPRPETELLVDAALAHLATRSAPVVVDLCTGSGAIAISIATESRADVTAVELSEDAFRWASENVQRAQDQIAGAGSSLGLLNADARDLTRLRPDLVGQVDVLTCNPPYIPDDAIPRDPEVADHDPPVALFGGPDGLDLIRDLMAPMAALVKSGGWVLIEHADVQGGADGVPGVLAAAGEFVEIEDHRDLTGRPRYTSARRR